MSTDSHGRVGLRGSGIAAVALWGAGVLIAGGGHLGLPGGLPEEDSGAVHDFYSSHADRVTLGAWVFMLGSLCFAVFAASVVRRVRRSDTALVSVATVAGIATGLLATGVAAGGLVAALEISSISADTAQSLNAVEAVFFVNTEMAAAGFFVSVGMLALRTSLLPRWWAVITVLLGAWLAFLPIGWVGLLVGVPAWTLLTAVVAPAPLPEETDAPETAGMRSAEGTSSR
jgi:hypothetical protein